MPALGLLQGDDALKEHAISSWSGCYPRCFNNVLLWSARNWPQTFQEGIVLPSACRHFSLLACSNICRSSLAQQGSWVWLHRPWTATCFCLHTPSKPRPRSN